MNYQIPEERLLDLIDKYVAITYPNAIKVEIAPPGGNVSITSLLKNLQDAESGTADEDDVLIHKMDAYGMVNININKEFLGLVKSMFGEKKNVKKLLEKWYDSKPVDMDLLGSNKEEQKEDDVETTEYARTLKNARRQGVDLRFPKSVVRNNPKRFRYYTRQNTNEMESIIKKVLREHLLTEAKEKKEWNEINGKLVREYKFSSYKDTIDFVNMVSEIAEEQNHHPKMIVGYDTVKVIMYDHEEGGISDKCHEFTDAVDDMMDEKKTKGEQTEGEITERCWKGYTQKGMKTMFGKRYPNCVKIKKK